MDAELIGVDSLEDAFEKLQEVVGDDLEELLDSPIAMQVVGIGNDEDQVDGMRIIIDLGILAELRAAKVLFEQFEDGISS